MLEPIDTSKSSTKKKDEEDKYKPSKRKVPDRPSSGEMDVYQRFKKF